MGIIDSLKERLAVSLVQRTGLREIHEQLLSVQEKLDWIMEKNFSVCHVDYEDISAKLSEKPAVDALTVAFITDEHYFDITLVAIWTLYEHQQSPYNVKLIAYRCTEEQEMLAKKLFPCLEIVSVNECDIPFSSDSHISKACMLKLLLPSLIPGAEYALYIDCDTLIASDLHELESFLAPSSPLAGVRDAMVTLSHFFRKTIFPLTHSLDYINTGVMLVNLEYWRQNDCTEGMLSLARKYVGMPYPDQDIVNLFFAGNLQFLPYKFNVMSKVSSNGLITDGQLAQIHQMRVRDIQSQKPSIYHISGPNKPWNTTSAFKYPLWREESARFQAYRDLRESGT